MAEKKISFGFKQVKKQPLLLPVKIEEKKNDVELIQCLEGQTIKLMHEKEKETALVIPCLNSQKTSTALASLQNLKKVLNNEEQDEASDAKKTENSEQSGPISLEQRVIKELLNEGKNDDENLENEKNKLTLPMASDKLPLEGAKESSLDDYDNIPISKFGFAMLRGMGLKDEDIISKNNKEPELRPKGMGLGADKVIKKAKLLVQPAANEVLELKKNAYVRILGGKHKDLYGQIEGLDDHACRVIVKLAVGGIKEVFNEFMVQPIPKQEYQQYGKVINSAKYEEYRKKQEEKEANQGIKTEVKTEFKKEIKKESKSEVKTEKSSTPDESRERKEPGGRSQREPSPRNHRDRNEYESSSRRRDRSRDRDRQRDEERRERSRERNKDRNRRSSSNDRNRSKDVERSHKNRNENRRSRSIDRYKDSSTSRTDRSRDDHHRRQHDRRSESTSKSSASDSDSSDSDSRHNKRSHHKKSKKKHKKKSSKKYDYSDDDRHVQKKTKKSKRGRSRSRDRR